MFIGPTKIHFMEKERKLKITEHGLKFEQEALDCYANNNNYKVLQLGLVICKNIFAMVGIFTRRGCVRRFWKIGGNQMSL
ncbi:hypothetical protein NQ315_011387 [Exocentrus adspersus]|uniref:Uncharacterized protein n=1 Tax=Exocentrus adspersus TaxID=1586481 RepID=A0AAV8V6H9_9CUCU|nr:hypothetical protein NQ315_011387 [Exocentrus adspersus]